MDDTAARRLAKIPGIGPALAAKLAARGLTTKAQLRKIRDELPREAQVHLKYNITQEIPLAVGDAIADTFKKRLVFGQTRYPVVAVGSVRRRAPVSKDVDLLVVVPGTPTPGLLGSGELAGKTGYTIEETYASGPRRRSVVVRGGAKYYAVDLFLATEQEKPYALFHYTNGRKYNIRIRAHAKKKGLTLNQYGVFTHGTKRRAPGSRAIRTERDLAKYLGVTYRTPKERTTA